jgi:hypothetical protein
MPEPQDLRVYEYYSEDTNNPVYSKRKLFPIKSQRKLVIDDVKDQRVKNFKNQAIIIKDAARLNPLINDVVGFTEAPLGIPVYFVSEASTKLMRPEIERINHKITDAYYKGAKSIPYWYSLKKNIPKLYDHLKQIWYNGDIKDD